ncbi:fungal-specific transcription factor domain-containing protein [Aspergillus alliaceus]|uniref:Fungal-specific transcription factor domain-containing protein n=1 Tax=Petromyces alliaceus TaxID=209559 RepID=A0A5N7BXC8_PETAA|nr:fungal-specific transcription factor domain-containing protein [Aspergillus alliaceus]
MKRAQERRALTRDYALEQKSRSCICCHRRKVRCDRKTPCGNCERAGWDCVYPSTIHRESTRHNLSLHQINERLERVESMLATLCDGYISSTRDNTGDQESENLPDARTASNRRLHSWEVLLEDGGRVQYINNSNIRDLLQDATTQESTTDTSSSPNDRLKLDILPGLSCGSTDPSQLFPEPSLALRLWATYVKSVNPVLKILHIPTTQSAIIGTILDPRAAKPSSIALGFAIFFAAVTSLDNREASEVLPETRKTHLKRFATGMDQALVQGDYMSNPSVTELQALAIFVTCLRVHDIGRAVWVLIGTTIRLAQSIGLHRDGQLLKLRPFEAEMRRRLWWHLCLLDSRSPEDHGFEFTIDVFAQMPPIPLNVNDSQLYPEMECLPAGSDSWTEMTFCLVQIEAAKILHPVLLTKGSSAVASFQDLSTKRKMIDDHIAYMQTKYLANYNPSNPLYMATFHHYHIACEKMKFMLQHREELYLHPRRESQDDLESMVKPSFKMAYGVLERSYSLMASKCTAQFRWLFRAYTQWYALAYVLRCLSVYPQCAEADLAWDMVDKIFNSIDEFHDGFLRLSATSESGSIWGCLVSLRAQALRTRMAQRRLHVCSDCQCPDGPGTGLNLPPASYLGLEEGAYAPQDTQMPAMVFVEDWSAIINGNLDIVDGP